MSNGFEIVRDGRFVVHDSRGAIDGFISEHNEQHVAFRVAAKWSSDNAGEVAYVTPPSFRVTDSPADDVIVNPPVDPVEPPDDEEFDYTGWTIYENMTFSGDGGYALDPDEDEKILIRNCTFKDNEGGLSVQKGNGRGDDNWIKDVHIINCRFVDNFISEDAERKQAAYIAQVDGLLIKGCYFDRNGWDGADGERSGYRHNLYLSRCKNVRVVSNVFRRESYVSLKLRTELDLCHNITIEYNVFLECPFPLDFATNDKPGSIFYRNVNVRNNVFARTLGWPLDEPGTLPTVRCFALRNVSGGTVEDNLFVDNIPEKGEAIYVSGSTPIENVVVRNNVSKIVTDKSPWNTHSGRKLQEVDGLTWENNTVSTDHSKKFEDFTGDVESANDLIAFYTS